MNLPDSKGKDSKQKTLFFDIVICQVLVLIIFWYQRYFYPLKGFYCAHRVLHGGEFCSQYVKLTFLEQDLMTAISMSTKEFKPVHAPTKY
jgi:putative component of membrane protein insertase Oxa1/YidC/SpoIIIJ protein YidD